MLLARTAMSRLHRLQTITLAVASVAVALTILLAQALRQLPLDQLHPAALATLALCALALLTAYGIVVAALRARAPDPVSSGG